MLASNWLQFTANTTTLNAHQNLHYWLNIESNTITQPGLESHFITSHQAVLQCRGFASAIYRDYA